MKTVLLTILDGWGIGDKCEFNAIEVANPKEYNDLIEHYPSAKIYADSEHVGLPDGQMGNSEVGHLNLGAGRIVYQELTKINKSIREGDFYKNQEFLKAIEHVKQNNSALHLYGLVSTGGVHSSLDHLYSLIELAAKNNLKEVYVHAFLDGRDTPPQSAIDFVAQVDEKLKANGLPQIATVIGRYYAMDRDKRWDRVEIAYNCLLLGDCATANSAVESVMKSYAENKTDEFVMPTNIGGEKSRIKDNDAVIFFNYRPDRAREITYALNATDFDGFERKKVLKNLFYVCMTQYDEKFGLPIAFAPVPMSNILAEVLDNNGLKEFRTAETEKYAHITFFFNGGVEKAFDSETRVLVASPKVATYDLKPEMSAFEVADNVVEALKSKKYSFILVNFANPDMVGHTGVMNAAVEAIEAIDKCLKKIVDAVKEVDAVMLLTADHGNAECMQDPITKEPFTAHTTNMVPFVLINNDKKVSLRDDGCLADVAPTILDILELQQPKEMTGKSLIVK